MILLMLLQYVLEFCVCSLIFTIIMLVGLRSYGEKGWNAKCRCSTRLDGKTVLITGGSSGIGLETARALAQRGARIILTCIHEHTAKAAAEDIMVTTGNPDIHHRQLDLASFDNIQKFAKDIHESFDKVHILVNNAGRTAAEHIVTEDDFEITMQVNYLGPALLTLLLLPNLKAPGSSRVVVVISKAIKTAEFLEEHIRRSESWSEYRRYAGSKLHVLLWTRALARRLPRGITVNAVLPGTTNTNIYATDNFLGRIFVFLIGKVFKTPKEGAQCSIHACLSPELEGVTGKYLENCQISNIIPEFEDYELTEKAWKVTQNLIDSRLTDETRI